MTDAATDDTATGAIRAADDEPTAVAPAGPGAGSATSNRLPWIAAIALFVIAVGLAVMAATLRSNLAAERDDRRDVERVSGQLATALLTYDYRDLPGWRQRVLVNATGSFRRTFADTFTTSLEPIVKEAKASQTGTVKDVFVGDIDGGSATAIVVADTVANGAAGRRSSFDTYIQLDLVQVDDHWRVNDVTNLNLGQPVGAGRGNGSTATTVPGTDK